MSVPAPAAGLLIHYAFLWPHEADAGADEGRKNRPCAVVVTTRVDVDGDLIVVLAPVTHTPPADPQAAIEVPIEVKSRLGLDTARSWVRLDCVNSFAWPGYDIRPIPGRDGAFDDGRLPEALWRRIRQGILDQRKARLPRIVQR